MSSYLNPSPHSKLLRVIVFVCGATLLLSMGLFVWVLYVQYSTSAAADWDFQGASGTATVIPSFAGVILAAWAIYFQVKSSSPSYKAAEAAWLDVSDLYHRVLKVTMYLEPFETEEEAQVEPEPYPEDLDKFLIARDEFPETRWEEGRREAADYAKKRCLAEFFVRDGCEVQGRRTLAELAMSVFPILDAIQYGLADEKKMDLFKLESDLDYVGVTLDFDEPETVRGARGVLMDVQLLIETLSDQRALEIGRIELAIRNPHHAADIRKRYEQEKKFRAELKQKIQGRWHKKSE